MMSLERRLGRLEAAQRPQQPIIVAVEHAPPGDVLAGLAADTRTMGRRLLCVVTGVSRAPGDPVGSAA